MRDETLCEFEIMPRDMEEMETSKSFRTILHLIISMEPELIRINASYQDHCL